MSNLLPIVIGAITIIFNVGGIIYLARNHFARVNIALERIDFRLINLESRISRLEGALSFPRNLTEN
jgi:hypothetical protein